jgi:hypothetical protein
MTSLPVTYSSGTLHLAESSLVEGTPLLDAMIRGIPAPIYDNGEIVGSLQCEDKRISITYHGLSYQPFLAKLLGYLAEMKTGVFFIREVRA